MSTLPVAPNGSRRSDSVAMQSDAARNDIRSLSLQLTVFALGFLAFGFALVPLYNVLCDVTGYGSRKTLTEAAAVPAANATALAARPITVEFLSTMPTVGEWEFRPVANSVQTQTGKLTTVTFVAQNLLAKPQTGQAVPSISPHEAAPYFHKTECFCFSPQRFGAQQRRELQVRFYVDRELPQNIDRVTLAYSMYGVGSDSAPN